MPSRIADRLYDARRRNFMDRADERSVFRAAVRAPDLPFLVLYIFGPGGVGKSTLVREFAAIAGEEGAAAHYLDARNIEPNPDAFLNALRLVLSLDPDQPPATTLANRPGRHVILLDTYELLTPLDNWLRETFLPQLPENVLVVLAGRNPPTPGWRADPGWQTILRLLPLRNLSSDDSRQYLVQRGVPADQCHAVLSFTHGHPLALSLVAETFAQRELVIFRPDAALDVIKTLVEQFVQKVPGPAHRAALEACAQVRVISEPLLGEMLKLPDAHELFDWLRELSFIESGPFGLFPHDLAREALVADLRWRHPDWYKELHRRARQFYIKRLGTGRRDEQQRLLFDLVFLHRDNPAVQPFFAWAESGGIMPDALREEDKPALLAMVARHEGDASAQLAAHWLARQPEGFLVFRGAQQQPIGFMNLVRLERIDAEDRRADGAVAAAWSHLQRHAPVRPGERATLFRFWMAADTYQAVSPVQSLTFIQAVNHYLTTHGLAFTFFPAAEPDFWAPVLAYADLARLDEADFEVGGRHYGVYGHDWRVMPPVAWLALLGEREVGAGDQPAVMRPTEQVIVLSQSDFAAAVRDALHAFVRPDQLRGNPLIRSRLVLEHAGDAATIGERVQTLQALVREAAEALQVAPRSAKLYRALYHTYFQPAPTQEHAAELLDVPFSTYRRHLVAGIAEVTDTLWNREVGG
jgi:hypothetical protein